MAAPVKKSGVYFEAVPGGIVRTTNMNTHRGIESNVDHIKLFSQSRSLLNGFRMLPSEDILPSPK